MQILELVLYGKNGQKRTLSFNPGKVNIIPGESKAGKSAVGDIIEYRTMSYYKDRFGREHNIN